MNSVEKQTVLHCLKAMIDEAVCEECPLYDTTGTDHCEKDCIRFAISALEHSQRHTIAIDNAMAVFDDFMCGEVDEDGLNTFLEMLKDKAESEDKE